MRRRYRKSGSTSSSSAHTFQDHESSFGVWTPRSRSLLSLIFNQPLLPRPPAIKVKLLDERGRVTGFTRTDRVRCDKL